MSLYKDVAAASCISLDPKGQIAIQFSYRQVKRRAIISPVIADPAADNGIEHPRQIFDRLDLRLQERLSVTDRDSEIRAPKIGYHGEVDPDGFAFTVEQRTARAPGSCLGIVDNFVG